MANQNTQASPKKTYKKSAGIGEYPDLSAIYRIAANLIRSSVSPDSIREQFAVSYETGECPFNALVKANKEKKLPDAIATVGIAFPPSTGGTWLSLAEWALEYETSQPPSLPDKNAKNKD